MLKYARIINETTGLCEVGLGTDEKFYLSIGMEEMDVQKSDVDNAWYLSDKCPMKTDEQKAQEEIDEIKKQLNELDLKTIRAIRAGEEEYISEYESQAQALRAQLSALE